MLDLALLAALAAAAAPSPGLQLPGLFHGDETVARDGEHWLALIDGTEGVRLQAVRVSVQPAHDPVLDDEDGRSGRIVESASGLGGAVVAYLHGPGLQARPVIRATIEDLPGQAGQGASVLRLAARTYRLETQCTPDASIRDAYRCTIQLVEGARHQTLAEMAGTRMADAGIALGDDASPHLIFAGDLDGDGALDLLYDRSDHYNVAAPTLFLSGAAAAGELVHPVVEQRTTGC